MITEGGELMNNPRNFEAPGLTLEVRMWRLSTSDYDKYNDNNYDNDVYSWFQETKDVPRAERKCKNYNGCRPITYMYSNGAESAN